ncbi:SDR family NAD(P)-dependent oxidoreductase [Pseudomonas typographi]|uniref:SDR family oxidoreductase n=1 Tax=Pseudomonas typographi TaxID=2715964 RepID=A0ABR7Z0Z1_9PSED|nr:SDR family oxidoreductase [Pseudomonas typographi]MBD1599069.1 SDR family oxidoreductase [Pseudomonas typographi]
MNNAFDLTGRKAVITGGSRGIGGAIAELFLEQGAEVAICHVDDDENAEALCDRMSVKGLELHTTECDVSDPASVRRFAGWAEERLGHVDIVVNSAGVGGGDRPFSMTDDSDWDRIVGVNLRGTMLVTHAFFGGMLARRYGRVINVASQLAYKGAPGLAHYCAAKAGVVGFTRALAYEGAPQNVMVNAIAPGPVDTELLRKHSRGWLAAKKAQLPIGRFGQVSEIAPTALLLAFSAGAFYAGQTLSPNGGDVML